MLQGEAWQCNGAQRVFPVIPGRRASGEPGIQGRAAQLFRIGGFGFAGFARAPE
jgi:hypothetical protein